MTEPQQNVGGGGGGINFKISERNYLVKFLQRERERREGLIMGNWLTGLRRLRSPVPQSAAAIYKLKSKGSWWDNSSPSLKA